MGLDISKIQNAKLQKLAYQEDTDNNNILDANEFTIFKQKAADVKVSKKAFNETMGLYVTEPTAAPAEEAKAEAEEAKAEAEEAKAEEAPVAETNVETKPEQTRKEHRQERKENKDLQNDIKSDIDNYIENKKSTVTLTNLVERLKNDNGTEAYVEVINQVEAVVNFVQATNFNSKNEVQALEKKIKNNTDFNDFQKSLAKEMVNLAENAQITKETAKLTEIYENIKAEEGREQNFTAYLEAVKEKMKNQGIAGNSYYSDEAFTRLEQQVTSEIQTWAHKEMKELKYDTVTAEKKKGIIAEILNKLPETDKFARKVVANMGDLAGVESRRINYQRNYDKNLPSISTEDLKKELGNGTYDLLTRNFLDKKNEQGQYIYKNADGTYNLQAIADVIKGAIGADWRMDSYGDEKRSEIQKAIDDLKGLIERGDLDEANLKKLAKLCKVEYTPRSHSPKDAFGNATNDAIMGAALAPLGAIKATAVAEAAVGTLVVAGAKATVSLAPLGALVAAPIVLDALANIIIGVKKDEETCFKFEEAAGKTVKEYAEILENTENEEKAKAIIVLAKAFEAKYKENWNTEFIKAMTAAAGNDRVLNCLEFRSAYPTILEGLKPEEKPVDDEHSYSQQDEEGTDPVYVNVPQIDGSKTSWAKIAQQYDCLVQKYQLQGAIRILKIAQAITDGDYSEKRLDDLYKLSLQGRKNLQNIEGFNYEIYCNKLDATYLPALEYEIDKNGNKIPKVGTGIIVPEKLGECTRDASLSLEVERATGPGVVVHPHGNAGGKIKVSDGTSSKYYVRLDGNVQVWDTAVFSNAKKLRDDAVIAFKAKHPNATVEKWEEE